MQAPRRLCLSSFSCLFVLLVAVPCQAHPVPRDNHDRILIVHLTPEAVVVEYRLELDEYRAVRDVPASALKGVESRGDFHAAFRRHFAPILADNLVAMLDGKELTFECREQRSEVLDHVRCDYRFVAPWKLSAGGPHRFTFREGNYPLDSFSVLNITLAPSPLLTLRNVAAPDAELRERPAEQRRPGDEEKLRRLSATVLAVPSFEPGPVRPPLPPELDAVRPGPAGRARRYAATVNPPSDEPTGRLWTTPPEPGPEPSQPRQDNYLLDLLLNTNRGLLVLLVLAAAFGAAHALTPGHGKTMVAAYLVGRRGTVWHALALGVTTTLAHTGSVLMLALLLALFQVGAGVAAIILNLGGGLLITGLGVWLLMQRSTGRADHIHLDLNQPPPANPSGPPADAIQPAGTAVSAEASKRRDEPAPPAAVPDVSLPGATWKSTLVLGIAGGLVPCWDAIILLLFSISTQRLWLGVALLLAFSAGLAGVLVLLGLIVVGASAGVHARWKDSPGFDRVVRLLPIASAVVIIVIGLLMTFSSVRAG